MHPDILALLAKFHHEELLKAIQDERVATSVTRPTTVLAPWPKKLHRTLFLLRLRRQSRRHRLAKRLQPTSWREELHNLLDDTER